MKSNKIKALIAILILTVSACSNLLRTEKTEVDATFKSLVKAQVTANGGDWTKGFNCPEILLSTKGGKDVNQGEAHIEGIQFLENKGDNLLGLVLTFKKPVAPNSLMSQVSKVIAGNKIYIPWRFLLHNFSYTNPFFNNKFIKGDLVNDQRVPFQLTIKFPYAYTTSYINDEQGNAIRKRMNSKSHEIHGNIRSAKEYIDRRFPAYKNANNDINNIKNGQKKIDEQILKNQGEIENIKKNNAAKEIELKKLTIEFNKAYIEAQANGLQIHKLNNEITETNAAVKAMSDSVTALNKSKNDPKIETDNANKAVQTIGKKADAHYNNLLKVANEKSASINASRAGFMATRTPDFKSNLATFVPL